MKSKLIVLKTDTHKWAKHNRNENIHRNTNKKFYRIRTVLINHNLNRKQKNELIKTKMNKKIRKNNLNLEKNAYGETERNHTCSVRILKGTDLTVNINDTQNTTTHSSRNKNYKELVFKKCCIFKKWRSLTNTNPNKSKLRHYFKTLSNQKKETTRIVEI